jgi:hypothetical protein
MQFFSELADEPDSEMSGTRDSSWRKLHEIIRTQQVARSSTEPKRSAQPDQRLTWLPWAEKSISHSAALVSEPEHYSFDHRYL